MKNTIKNIIIVTLTIALLLTVVALANTKKTLAMTQNELSYTKTKYRDLNDDYGILSNELDDERLNSFDLGIKLGTAQESADLWSSLYMKKVSSDNIYEINKGLAERTAEKVSSSEYESELEYNSKKNDWNN